MNTGTINKKGIMTLLLIFSFMYLLNSLTPLFNEDYFRAFVWPEGLPNLGRLPENTQKVSTFFDVLENARVYYFIEGGRVPGCVLSTLFSWLGKKYFNPLNALMTTVLVMEIYWLQHEGKVTFDFRPSCLFWIFFSLWAFNIVFVDTNLWIAGSCDYLWMLVIVLLFLIPYTKNYYNPHLLNDDTLEMTAGMFFLGLLSGCSHETTICWLLIILLYWLYLCKKENTLQNWKIAGFIGLCTGYALLIFAPGNYARLFFQQQANNARAFSQLFNYKTIEFLCINYFHFLVWYFIVRFFSKYKNKIKQIQSITPYLKLAAMFTIIALGSGIFMFIIPVPMLRPSFLNLVFLTIAVALLFRAEEVIKESVIQQKTKLFLKLVGCFYFILTISVSIWFNYTNWNQWNNILAIIQKEQKNPTNIIINVEPYSKWSSFARGFHLIPMPVYPGDENNFINATVAYYYGIKGISCQLQ